MQIQTSTHVVIAGSRQASADMIAYARRVVQRVHQLGWIIVVGDNPQGVDRAVAQECRRLRAKVIVAGIANLPRNGGCKHGSYVKVDRDLYRSAGGSLLNAYTVRDRWMVDLCQRAVFVWNGDSPGTAAGYKYAILRSKEAHLITFEQKVMQYD